MAAITQTNTFYGSDTTCTTDLPLIDLQVTDPRILIGQRVVRRLTTPRGALATISDDPNFGWDVRQYVNKKMSPGETVTAQNQIQQEVLKDEQVGSASVQLIFTPSRGDLAISVSMVSAAGPFLLTLNVRDLTVEAVFQF